MRQRGKKRKRRDRRKVWKEIIEKEKDEGRESEAKRGEKAKEGGRGRVRGRRGGAGRW